MKPLLSLSLSATLLMLAACSGNPDAVETAQKANEARHDDLPAAAEAKADYNTEFMTKAASGGMLEVELGKYVAQHATTPEAKKFAEMMVKDHTPVNEEMMALARRKNVILPARMGEDQQVVYDDVVEKKGLPLDREYLREMVQDHEDDIQEFTEASERAGDPDDDARHRHDPVVGAQDARPETVETVLVLLDVRLVRVCGEGGIGHGGE